MSLQPKDASPYQQLVREVLDGFRTDPHRGLSEQEASSRLERFGPNELAPTRKVPEWRKLLAEFQDPLVILLLVATAISAGVSLYERKAAVPYKAIAILAVVLLNALMAYIQEAASGIRAYGLEEHGGLTFACNPRRHAAQCTCLGDRTW